MMTQQDKLYLYSTETRYQDTINFYFYLKLIKLFTK